MLQFQKLTPKELFEKYTSGKHYTFGTYGYQLNKYLEFCHVRSLNDLPLGPLDELEERLLLFIEHLRSEGYPRKSVNVAFSAAERFYVNNRINLPWKSLRRVINDIPTSTRPRKKYTHEQIAMMLKSDKASKRLKGVIALLAKAGPRVGAVALDDPILFYDKRYDDKNPLDVLRYGDIRLLKTEPPSYGLVPYKGQGPEHEYFTFIDPQGEPYMTDYLEAREKQYGTLKKSDWLFCSMRDPDIPLMKDAIYTEFSTLLARLHIRQPSGNKLARHQTPIFNGFREFHFTCFANTPGLSEIQVKYMTGHRVKLGDSYYTPSPQEALEMYAKCVPNLRLPL